MNCFVVFKMPQYAKPLESKSLVLQKTLKSNQCAINLMGRGFFLKEIHLGVFYAITKGIDHIGISAEWETKIKTHSDRSKQSQSVRGIFTLLAG